MLEPLSEQDSETLLDELAATSIARKCGGASARRPRGIRCSPSSSPRSRSTAGRRSLPPTIQALLAERLDRLEPTERIVLEHASVVGREFSRGAVVELSPPDDRADVSPALLALVRKELVRPELSAFVGDDGFRFRHALIRDAAYSAMPKRARGELHERFAAWLERHEGDEELVGYHLEQTSPFRAELGAPDEALSERAAALLAAAGRRAFARDDARAAAGLFLRACELLRSDDAARLEPLRRASLALWWSGNVEDARRLLDEQIALAATLGNAAEEWSGRLDLAAGNLVTGTIDADGLLEVAEEAIRVFDPGDDAGLARAWRRVAHAYMAKGRYADSGEASERALAHARAAGERFEEARIVDLLCTSLLYGPAPADAAVLRCEGMLADAGGNQVLGANIAAALVGLLGMRGAFDDARERARLAEEIYLELDLQLAFAGLTQVTGPMELLAGDPAAAERELQRGLDILEPSGADGYQEALLAEALYGQGRLDEAERHARTAEAHAPADNVQAQVAWRGVRAKLGPRSRRSGRTRSAVKPSRSPSRRTRRTCSPTRSPTSRRVARRREDAAADATRRALDLYERKGNVAAARLRPRALDGALRTRPSAQHVPGKVTRGSTTREDEMPNVNVKVAAPKVAASHSRGSTQRSTRRCSPRASSGRRRVQRQRRVLGGDQGQEPRADPAVRGDADAEGLAGNERPREVVRVERAQVVELLAHADQLHRQAELVGDRDATPPFAEPSSFVSATPVTPTASPNRRACWSAVLAGRRVDDEQRLVRRALELVSRSRGAPSRAPPSGSSACAGGRRCRRSRRRARAPRAASIAS